MLFRSLVERGIIQFLPKDERRPGGRKLQVNMDLQADFSLNQALSLYLLDTIKLIDPFSETYALDLLTVVESILENPELILRRQLDRLKTIKMGEMKAAGIEYDERIAELEKLEHPKPNREFIYDTFNRFAAEHPWVGSENIRPKAIAREMYEYYLSFEEYVREYELQRTEGLLLRYLSEVFKVLVQTVPESYRNDEIQGMIAYFGTMIHGIDSSLLDEWEKLRGRDLGRASALEAAASDAVRTEAYDVTRDKQAFTVLVRNEVFRVVRALAVDDYAGVLALVEPTKAGGEAWTTDELKALLAPYYEDHQYVLTDRKARLTQHTKIETGTGAWSVKQTLVDPDDADDWSVDLQVDLEKSRQAGKPVLLLERLGPI
jgi:hypothetical protein